MIEQPKIAILLATYNGSKYLEAQLDSLLSQTYQNIVIVARDDCSTDTSVDILQRYSANHHDKFHIVANEATNKGASGSFSFLLEYVLEHKQALELSPVYMMFCDQDDVWFQDKIEQQLNVMLATEAGTTDMPVLVHSDLEVVSEQLQLIAPSLAQFQGLETDRNQFCNMIISNLVTGCTALLNEALAVKACPVAKQAIMHDWWLALVAAAFGKVVFLDQPLVHYRQHGKNTIGAKEYVKESVTSMNLLQRVLTRKPNEHLFEVARQAQGFLVRYNSRLTAKQRTALRIAAAMHIRIGLVQRLLYRVGRRF